MLFSERSIWTMVHGIGLGGAALLGLAAALFYLYAVRPTQQPTGNATEPRVYDHHSAIIAGRTSRNPRGARGSDASSRASGRCREGTRRSARPALRAREPDRLAAAGPSRAVGGRPDTSRSAGSTLDDRRASEGIAPHARGDKRIRAETEKLRIAAREEKALRMSSSP